MEQFEIIQTFLDIAVFPEPILSNADVVQRIVGFVVAKRLPRVVLEDSVLYAGRIIAHLASIPPSPIFLNDPGAIDLLPGKSR